MMCHPVIILDDSVNCVLSLHCPFCQMKRPYAWHPSIIDTQLLRIGDFGKYSVL